MTETRDSIIEKYQKLEQLENYEALVEYFNRSGRNHWWKIDTPEKKIFIEGDDARESFTFFIVNEIRRIKADLNLV